ncbi:MAG: amidase [Alphaproteobacteria bacterium]|nr:amidase [Alphaproteobacteria bacterium]
MTYHPTTFRGLTWCDSLDRMANGETTPREYLESCLEIIAAREPVVQALTAIDEDGSRARADASTRRWKDGRALSAIDGMPIGIKDLLETATMPTEMGCAAFRGNFPRRDNAAVRALRAAGAIILAKTVTAELGGSHPGPTTNPHDASRSPGGSSSGSAAAVAAGMMPTAIGTQVAGSIIRPAAYCGNVAIKPSKGAINRGERQATSMSVHGVHANGLEDMWRVAIEIAKRAGGDPGHAGLSGPDHLPEPVRPNRLVVLHGAGWDALDPGTRSAFDAVCAGLKDIGVEMTGAGNDPRVDELEQLLVDSMETCNLITGWENHWLYRNLVDQDPDSVSPRAREVLARAEALTPADYRDALQRRAAAQQAGAAVLADADAIVMLSCPGPAHVWQGDRPGEPLTERPTGDPVFNAPSSYLFAPAVTMPLLAVDGLPVGVQVMGPPESDARVTALARWIMGNLSPISI